MNQTQSAINTQESISEERQSLLLKIALTIQSQLNENGTADVMFICTHNSRRSQLAQVLATLYAHELKLSNIHFYSGGTEATSFNYRMINALLKNDIELIRKTDSINPVYRLYSKGLRLPGLFFSKAYTHELNPSKGYIAIMVCDHADEHCPVVFGASERFSLHFKDPKEADDTDQEESAYTNKIAEIGNELYFLLNRI